MPSSSAKQEFFLELKETVVDNKFANTRSYTKYLS